MDFLLKEIEGLLNEIEECQDTLSLAEERVRSLITRLNRIAEKDEYLDWVEDTGLSSIEEIYGGPPETPDIPSSGGKYFGDESDQ